jgi:hypothetical protein
MSHEASLLNIEKMSRLGALERPHTTRRPLPARVGADSCEAQRAARNNSAPWPDMEAEPEGQSALQLTSRGGREPDFA